MSLSNRRLALVSVKAFGDLVIALTVVSRVPLSERARIEMLLAKHLQPLFDALNVDVTMRLVRQPEPEHPALFQVREQGLAKAISSAIGLRSAIAEARRGDDATLVFDYLTLRERFISLGAPAIGLPKAPNLYLAYERLFETSGFTLESVPTPLRAGNLVRIFPASRVAMKRLPVTLVERIVGLAAQSGAQVELALLRGERPDLETSGLPIFHIERTFGAMAEAVRGADLVVSADSLPAHIAAFCRRPVFVYSPFHNPYWLPPSAFAENRTAVFDQDDAALADFLDLAKPLSPAKALDAKALN